MPDQTLQVLLDPDVLTERYVQAYNAEDFPLTAAWWTGTPRQERADSFRWLQYNAISTPAPLNVSGGTARILTPNGAQEKFGACYSIFNSSPVDGEALTALRNPDSRELQAKGIDSVTRVFDEFTLRHQILRELILAKSLSTGIVYIGQDGQILESSSGAIMTVDLGVPAGNKTNLGGVISSLWSVSTAKIGDQLDAWVRTQSQANQPRPTDIWVNRINLQHLRNNDQFVEWAAYNNTTADAVLRGDVIQGLWGFNWHFVSGSYTTSTGTTADFIPQQYAILTPPPSHPTFHRTSHLTLVPDGVGIASTWQEALGRLGEKFGPYSYATIEHNPARLDLYMGDKFGFVYRDPRAIAIATCFPSS